ncbi:MAG: NAD-dependent epimerase/dehydratase family protein [Pseudomonadota bacterium]
MSGADRLSGNEGVPVTVSLVTGGNGFIGQHLVDRLTADGDTVRVLDIEPPAKRHAKVEYVEGSVTDANAVREAIDGVHHLYHIAAIPHLWIPNPALFQNVNVAGTEIVFEEAARAQVARVVHTSSATVLIERRGDHAPTTLNEEHRTREQDLAGHYARSKWRAENVARSYADRLEVVIVMPTLPLGPGDRHLTPPSRMLRDFVSGTNRAYADCILNIVDVRDVAAGHHLACRSGRSGERYLLNSHSLTMASFLECLEGVTDRPMPKWKVPGGLALAASAVLELWSNLVSRQAPVAPLAGTRMSRRPITFDSAKAERELGLPSRPLVDTLTDAVAWLGREGHLKDDRGESLIALGDG